MSSSVTHTVARRRLKSLLDKMLARLDRWTNEWDPDYHKSANVPIINVQQALETARYLMVLGCQPSALRLMSDSRDLNDRIVDLFLSNLARGESAEFQQRLVEIFGPYPKPDADTGEHEERLNSIWREIHGRALQLVVFVRELRNDLDAESRDKNKDQRSTNKRKPIINARMLDIIQKQPDCRGWTITQWQKKLKCSRAGIQGPSRGGTCRKYVNVCRQIMPKQRDAK